VSRARVGRGWFAALVAGALLVAGCGDDPEPAPEPSPVAVAWRDAVLPLPAGSSGAVMVRDATSCPGVWFAVGAVRDAQGGTSPAAWSSTDGVTWSPLRIVARTYYGRQNVLSSVACREGRVAALGAKTGGAHANPRTSSWRQDAAGVLQEVTAPFELFGGPQAVNVVRMDAGPRGFLITGNRMSGAAVWTSVDSAKFQIVERAPQLASDAAGETWAFDGTAVSEGWLAVGGFLPKGRIDRDPMGWRSADGSAWSRVTSSDASDAYEELQRVVVLDSVPVAVGVRGPVFGVWRLDGDRWRPVGSFGAVQSGGASSVRSVSVVGRQLFAVTADRAGYAVWVSDDGGARWAPVGMPSAMPAGPENAVVVAGAGGRAVLVSDDGISGRLYTAEIGT
jgi:hypothetical protein